MNKKTFIKILEDKDIIWNDLVTLYVTNPLKRRWEFWKPNMLSYHGALGFTLRDNAVQMCVEDPNDEFNSIFLYFNFEEIIGIEKDKKQKRKIKYD